MRTTLLLALLAVVGSVVASTESDSADVLAPDLSEELRKPIILNKMLDPEGGRKLASIASVLAREPDVGSEAPTIKITDDDVLATSADIKLLNDGDSADKMRFNEKDPKKNKKKKENDSVKKEVAERVKADPTQAEIRSLQKMIKKAMQISKAIPDKVKRLQELKQKEEQMTEERARREAVRTLEEHKNLMRQMAEHISKLESKLKALKTKKKQLEESDEKLRNELAASKKSGPKPSSSKGGSSKKKKEISLSS